MLYVQSRELPGGMMYDRKKWKKPYKIGDYEYTTKNDE